VLGVSECSDLAVIDISGDGYDYLDWYDGEVVSGLSIFAAGYPLGNPEYTLLDGIVSKERADGETTWASVDYTIEHSADTLPGNSGGPIVTAEGAVVAVNYAGNQLGQSFAIAREEALPVIDLLIAGTDVDSIGLNGEAFLGIFPGIWVYSVESGSPADVAGIQAGDLITRMEGLDLALDGTMAVYCDILRSHDATDVLAVEVYRYASDEILAGQLNGDELAPVFSFTDEIVDEVPIDEGAVAATAYDEYTDVTDDGGLLVMRVPVEWDDVNGAPWVTADEVDLGVALSASPDLDGFLGGWDTAGVFVGATSQVSQTITEALDDADFGGACIFADRLDYDDGLYQGMFDVWTDCGDAGSTFLVVVAEPPDGSFQVLVQIAIIEDRDWDAADKIISSFEVVGTP
jgi:serine protease Do